MITPGYTIIGGGLVGLATAYRLLQSGRVENIVLLEKDARIASQQSTHNSGVLHSGLYYKPGSEKALLSVQGLQQMVEFCQHHHIPHEICGKIVVATAADELPRLASLWERGQRNGLTGLKRLTVEEIREIEPHAAGIAALRVPQEGIVDYRAVADTLAAEIARLGGRIILNARVRTLRWINGAWTLATTAGDFHAAQVVNCGGLHSDRIVQLAGQKRTARIIPFRGEYYKLKPASQRLVRHLIYPVPDPNFPFLGVHFTRLIAGGVEAGPNAVLAFAREGYAKTTINLRDLADALTFPGLWRFIARYPRMSWYELYRSFSRREFCRSLQRLVPEVQSEDLEPGDAGVRAQAMFPDGRLVEDFHFVRGQNILHVVNAPSPAATASLAIGSRIVRELLGDNARPAVQ
jgi:L-2-hydroxyglutarate oxidase